MKPPEVPDATPKTAVANAGRKAATGTTKAARTGTDASEAAGQGVSKGASGAAKGVAQVGGEVAALPGRAVGLAKLLTLRRFLRAAPVVAVVGAAVVAGRRIARKR
ncbi:hypothetical protein [Actinomadura sp. NEAU-AAG7]|uniref:hypothetical protein n=1 Tax=Actinomadura sp. NEAU-AAG7 TaxID=2839640 RepID=UPI001BE3E1CF|nr:hypothetical protein [Actinomadura sp. NEAU-AAG7]MBT2212574.1 hypothetical protein [Actinomadura sp. NEAU-AAG7]